MFDGSALHLFKFLPPTFFSVLPFFPMFFLLAVCYLPSELTKEAQGTSQPSNKPAKQIR